MNTTLCNYIHSLADVSKHPVAMRSDEIYLTPDLNPNKIRHTTGGFERSGVSSLRNQHIAKPCRCQRIEYGRRLALNLGTRTLLQPSLMQCLGETKWLLVDNDISLAEYGSPNCVTSQKTVPMNQTTVGLNPDANASPLLGEHCADLRIDSGRIHLTSKRKRNNMKRNKKARYISPIEYKAWKQGLIDDPYKYSKKPMENNKKRKPCIMYGYNTI